MCRPSMPLSYTGVARAYVAQWRRPTGAGRRSHYYQPAAGSRAGGELVRAALLALHLGGTCVFDGLFSPPSRPEADLLRGVLGPGEVPRDILASRSAPLGPDASTQWSP